LGFEWYGGNCPSWEGELSGGIVRGNCPGEVSGEIVQGETSGSPQMRRPVYKQNISIIHVKMYNAAAVCIKSATGCTLTVPVPSLEQGGGRVTNNRLLYETASLNSDV